MLAAANKNPCKEGTVDSMADKDKTKKERTAREKEKMANGPVHYIMDFFEYHLARLKKDLREDKATIESKYELDRELKEKRECLPADDDNVPHAAHWTFAGHLIDHERERVKIEISKLKDKVEFNEIYYERLHEMHNGFGRESNDVPGMMIFYRDYYLFNAYYLRDKDDDDDDDENDKDDDIDDDEDDEEEDDDDDDADDGAEDDDHEDDYTVCFATNFDDDVTLNS